MRRLLACLVAALALPGAAAATMMPPLHGVQPGVRFVPTTSAAARKTASCSEQGRSAKAARLTRKIAPVACEQPPKPKLVNSLSGAFFGR